MRNSVLYFIPILLLFPVSLSFSTDRCSSVFKPKNLDLSQNLIAPIQQRKSKREVSFKPWFEELVHRFEGNEKKAKKHIIGTLVEYEVTYTKKKKDLKNLQEKFTGWPSYATIVRYFPDIGKEVTRQLTEKKYKWLPKKRKNARLWYSEMLNKFNGDKEKTHTYIIETILKYGVTSGNYARIYRLNPVFENWPSYPRLPLFIRQEIINKRERKPIKSVSVKDWYNKLVDIHQGNNAKTLAYIVETILKYKVTVSNYRTIYNQYPSVFESWPSLPYIKLHFPKILEEVNFRRYGRAHFSKIDTQAWYKNMLKLNGESVEATITYIANILVKFNVTDNNYKEIYDRYPEIFNGWPSYQTIQNHFPEIITKAYEAKGKVKKKKPIVVQDWFKNMLKLNGGNLEATITYIANILAKHRIKSIHDSYNNEIYKRHPEIFENWPSFRIIVFHFPQIQKKLEQLRNQLQHNKS